MNNINAGIESIFNGQLKDDKFRTPEEEIIAMKKIRLENAKKFKRRFGGICHKYTRSPEEARKIVIELGHATSNTDAQYILDKLEDRLVLYKETELLLRGFTFVYNSFVLRTVKNYREEKAYRLEFKEQRTL